MAKGYFIGRGDKTYCGGEVLEGHEGISWDGLLHSHEGDLVSCGKDGKIYTILGGVSHFTSDGKRVAGTLDSISGCPCRSPLIPSITTASYVNEPTAPPRASPSPAASYTPAAAPLSPTASQRPAPSHAPDEIEEEEEEVEHEQLITLRLGVFFDGTGNNHSNSESVAGCMARDVGLEDVADEILRFCVENGYGIDDRAPDSSYGNDVSNIARLYELYADQSDETLEREADEAAIKVYVEGIGTVSGGKDDLYAQATGQGKTGVLARVRQSPSLILENLRLLITNNPEVKISRIEVDIFGFSRGAAAARHFANDLRKGAHSLLAKALPAGSSMLVDGFAWRVQQDIVLNFIGLFDTVPGIVSPFTFDFSPGNNRNSGLDLALPKSAARKIVQLVARDEHRLNFALIRSDHDIVLPGSHSDIGGGYRPRMRERLLVGKTVSRAKSPTTPTEHSIDISEITSTVGDLVNRLVEQGVELKTKRWSTDVQDPHNSRIETPHFFAVANIDREVEGDLSKVYLRVMREWGLRHGVPFKKLTTISSLALPQELEAIAAKLQAYALVDTATLNLSEAEEALLLRRYIHISASWNAVNNWNSSEWSLLFINRPTDNHKRVLYANY